MTPNLKSVSLKNIYIIHLLRLKHGTRVYFLFATASLATLK